MRISEEHQVRYLFLIKGLETKVEVVLGESVNTRDWNPLHFAIYYGKLGLIDYYLNQVLKV